MLVEIAIGDAYGAGFEYVSPDLVRKQNDLSSYVQHPRHGTRPGCYTDDTQMSIALAELIVSGREWTPANIASHFVDAFKRDPREGYAGRFYEFLCSVQSGEEFLQQIRPESDKSGAAMRACVVGIYPSLGDVVERSTIQARVTHDTPDGVRAAVAASLMAHYFVYQLGPRDELGRFLKSHVPGDWDVAWRGKVGPKGWMSVRAAVTAVMNHDRMSDLLRACIAYSGDVDTVAAIALGAASACSDVRQDLPPHLLSGLENVAFGRDYLVALDRSLWTVKERFT